MSNRFDMRLGALAIAGIALIGGAIMADSVEDRKKSADLMQEMRDHQQMIEDHDSGRSRSAEPVPSSSSDPVETVMASDEDLIDDTSGIAPVGVDPTGFDPTPPEQRPAINEEQAGEPTMFIENEVNQ